METGKMPKKVAATLEELQALANRAEEGDEAAASALEARLKEHPNGPGGLVDIRIQALGHLFHQITGGDALFNKCLSRQMGKVRRDAAGPDPSPLENLLAERVAICYLQAYHADAVFADAMEKGLSGTEAAQRYQDRSHKRLLQAVKALAQVRRLGLPAFQINIGEKQLNVL